MTYKILIANIRTTVAMMKDRKFCGTGITVGCIEKKVAARPIGAVICEVSALDFSSRMFENGPHW